MRTILMLPVLLGLAGLAVAQTPAAVPAPPEPLEGRQNQKIERIRHEDAGSRIDEVRVGGQTQSITVQPKVEGVPAMGVAGRFYTDGTLARGMDNVLRVVEYLVGEVKRGR